MGDPNHAFQENAPRIIARVGANLLPPSYPKIQMTKTAIYGQT